MRHLFIRGVLVIIWVVVAIICGTKGNLEMACLYGVLGCVFLYSTVTMWKKKKEGAQK